MQFVKSAVVGVLGTRPVSALARRATPGRLRIVAYHGVPDASAFALHIDRICRDYRAVSGAEVATALRGEAELPERAVWLTFDDGLGSVVDTALPILQRRRVPATVFVCPGLTSGSRRLWTHEVRAAARRGWSFEGISSDAVLRHLKRLEDAKRRPIVEGLGSWFGDDIPAIEPTLDVEQIRTWLDAGLEVGNHTWDHPCLDQCTADEQRQQIMAADEWLRAIGAFESVRLFAYPNGDWTPVAEQCLDEGGYDAALIFDHRLAEVTEANRLRLSRLRLDSDVPLSRVNAVLSGAHSALLHRSTDAEMT